MSDPVEYPPGSDFPGVIGRTVVASSPAWPASIRAGDGVPNVLFVVLDDVGYGQLSCFGGMVETPNIDRVAASELRSTTGRRSSRAPPSTATTSARTWPTRRSSTCSTRTSTPRRNRSSCTTRRAALTRRITSRASGPTRYAGKFDDGWDAYREATFARQKELGLLPADAQLSPRDPDVPEWSSLSADERRLYARMMEVFAGFVSHCDHHFGRLLSTLEQIGELENTLIMVISDNGASAVSPARSTRCGSSTWCRRASRTTSRTSTTSAAPSRTTTTVGLGVGRATRRSGAGSARPTAAARPTRSWWRGRRAWPRGARSARSTPTRSTWSRRCSTRSACRRRQRSVASRSRRSRA